jgi:hypothetical protein
LVVAFGASAALAAGASASQWKFNGVALSAGESETVTAETAKSSLAISGLTTSCAATAKLTVSNVGGAGAATVNSISLSGCGTNGVCTVEEAKANGLPWSAATASIGGSSYVTTGSFNESFLYGGAECAVEGWTFTYKGSIGGLFDNSASKLVFDAASEKATGSKVTTFGSTSAKYSAEFSVKATGAHAGQTLTLS